MPSGWRGGTDRSAPTVAWGDPMRMSGCCFVRSYEQALRIITQYYPLERFPQKALDALEDLLPQRPA